MTAFFTYRTGLRYAVSALLLILGLALLHACSGGPKLSLAQQAVSADTLEENATTARLAYQNALLNGINAFLQGTDEAETSDEAAVLNTDLIPAKKASLLTAIASRLKFVDSYSRPEVKRWLAWYQKHPQHLRTVLKNGERYLGWIHQEVAARGMPSELALLPAVESGFDPWAESPSGAAGLWQFTRPTGDHLGLERDWWGDERRDVVQSTAAALDYLQYLAGRFDGDWMIALAAYNSGEGNVSKALRRAKRKGQPLDFWSLGLPPETRAYIPKLLAMAAIINHPKHYGVELWPLSTGSYFTEYLLDSAADLALLADMANISLEEIQRLNPGLDHWATPLKLGSGESGYRLKIPANRAAAFLQSMAGQQGPLWHTEEHEVAGGESVGVLAEKYRITRDWLRQANGLENDRLRAGQRLLIPRPAAQPGAYPLTLAQRQARWGKRRQYTVLGGDSLWLIARRHKVSVRDLQRWNNLGRQSKIMPGQRLALHDRRPKRTESAIEPGYKVRPGDTLWDIARAFDLRSVDLARWNEISRNAVLRPGQRLKLWPPESEQGREGVVYTVQSGDSLSVIGSRLGVRVSEICRWNDIQSTTVLRPGQQLILFARQQTQSTDRQT